MHIVNFISLYLPTAREGNIFTGLCPRVGGGGVISLPVSGPMVHPGVWGCGLYWDVCVSSRGG